MLIESSFNGPPNATISYFIWFPLDWPFVVTTPMIDENHNVAALVAQEIYGFCYAPKYLLIFDTVDEYYRRTLFGSLRELSINRLLIVAICLHCLSSCVGYGL